MIRIRLQRRGRRKRPIHHIVVADSRSPRDGRIIEDLGRFDNVTPQNQVTLNEERVIHWIQQGAQPSDTVRSILKKQGILYKIHLMNWGKSEEEIEQALAEWREAREAKVDKPPTRKERQRALLDAEEKEYQKQLKKKAEEAAKQKAKEEALASEEEEEGQDEAEEAEAEEVEEVTAKPESAETAETEETQAEEPEEAGTASQPEVEKEAEAEAAPEQAEETDEETTAEEAGTAAEPEVQKEAEKEASKAEAADESEDEEAESEQPQEEAKAEETEDETEAESDDQVSTDMTAKEAIAYIRNTELDELEGFVPKDEDRVTVQRAWESKQEE